MSELIYVRRLYDKNGVFVRCERYDPVREIGPPEDFPSRGIMVNADAQLYIDPAYREQTVEATHIVKNEIIPLGTFSEKAFYQNKPVYWFGEAEVVKGGAGSDLARKNGPIERNSAFSDLGGDFCMTFTGRPKRSLNLAKSVSSVKIPLKAGPNMEIEINFDFRIRSRTGNQKADMLLFYRVQCGDYYLSDDPVQWQRGGIVNVVFISINEYDNWQTKKIITLTPPLDGDFQITFFQPVYYDPTEYPQFAKDHTPRLEAYTDGILQLDNVSARFLFSENPPSEKETATEVNDKKYSLVPDADQITHGDVPEYKNAELVYPYAWRVNNLLTKEWQRYGYPEAAKLIDLNLQTLVDANRLPTRRITATLDALISPHHYLRITYDNGRTYKINAFSWNVREREVEVELLEVLDSLPVRPNYLLHEDYRIVLLETGTATLLE